MTRRRLVVAPGSVAIATIALTAAWKHPPMLVWNASASVPIGLYAMRNAERLATGELVVARPPEALADFLALAVRSDLAVEAQATAQGATWLDRRLIAREPVALSKAGFGGEVHAALNQRTEHLVSEGLARRQGQRVLFAGDLLDTFRQRELAARGDRLAAETGLPARTTAEGEHVTGIYRQRITLASGRFAMIEDGLGFSLVPWTPTLERHLGRHVAGVATAAGLEWSFGRQRGLVVN